MNAEKLKLFMRNYPQGVTVVTTSLDSRLWGITVSAFTSVSLEPPLILVSISKTAPSHEAFTKAKFFAVNLLSHDQSQVSDIFAGLVEGVEKFEKVDYKLSSNGLP
ncbi:MAG TPA: flavin reductase, partial [Aigarchaeota archaeon]|nr:flavin reductase [Aigarchaeota archaeon]